jgi:hypothetical protein
MMLNWILDKWFVSGRMKIILDFISTGSSGQIMWIFINCSRCSRIFLVLFCFNIKTDPPPPKIKPYSHPLNSPTAQRSSVYVTWRWNLLITRVGGKGKGRGANNRSRNKNTCCVYCIPQQLHRYTIDSRPWLISCPETITWQCKGLCNSPSSRTNINLYGECVMSFDGGN